MCTGFSYIFIYPTLLYQFKVLCCFFFTLYKFYRLCIHNKIEDRGKCIYIYRIHAHSSQHHKNWIGKWKSVKWFFARMKWKLTRVKFPSVHLFRTETICIYLILKYNIICLISEFDLCIYFCYTYNFRFFSYLKFIYCHDIHLSNLS